MSKTPTPDACLHPGRGEQERILGSGTEDYYCRGCREAMPIIPKPERCTLCGSTTGHIRPEPEHGMSWHCPDCDRNWGWVK
ncbi:hypothetical protein Ppa06_64880 [Planomonospora parontospora subsp. parontospora]|uniref:Uncharacterized protein n=2 Tax=Planomonospora parontospora TaxID=58119 RepID=A0AA37BMQ6_9ACTN|nr:hypothetical protein [Planomonospora parontospora]GGK94401.1 hypothetical protein GCM10010126_62340 [Planomonospora parontospora]GII12690.1 hypothetical protein Ppa06_64880 [Planomonospora parontospora subsp. parontospora]